jgi:hypothetical protein
MEKIMSKTNETSNLEDHHTLADSELDAVTGGFPGLTPSIPIPPPEPSRTDPYRGFSFRIDVSGIARGGF